MVLNRCHIFCIICCLVLMLLVQNTVTGQKLSGQNTTLDSLRGIISGTQADSEKVRALNALARIYRFTSSDKATEYAHKAQVLAQTILDTVGESVALRNLGILFMDKGFTEKAIKQLLRAVRLSEQIEDSSGVAKSLNVLGLINQQKNQYTLAGTYLRTALPLAIAIKDTELVSYIRNNLGLVLWKTRSYDSALVEFQYVLSIQLTLRDSANASRALHNIGLVYLDKRDTTRAEEYFLRSEKLSTTISDQPSLMKANYYLALLYLARHRTLEALSLASKAYNVATALGYRSEKRNIAILLADCNAEQKNYQAAYKYSTQAVLLSDTLYNTESAKRIASLQTLYDTERKDFEIKRLEQASTIQKMEQSRDTIIRLSLLGALLIALLGVFGLARLYRQKEREHDEVVRQQQMLEEQAMEIELVNTELQANNMLLMQANTTLENMNTEKNELMGIVAHDLKNPLANIRTSVELLLRYDKKMNEKQKKERLQSISTITERTFTIVNNLLEVNALESGKMVLHNEPLNITDILHHICLEHTEYALSKEISLHVVPRSAEESAVQYLNADRHIVIQIFDNLISNAIKYSTKGTTVTIRTTNNEADGKIRIAVQDEGPGISPDDMHKLFGKFARLSARPTGGEHSTGLGLSIVKKMVEAMNGKVWCESELGKGATFIVEFPKSSDNNHLFPRFAIQILQHPGQSFASSLHCFRWRKNTLHLLPEFFYAATMFSIYDVHLVTHTMSATVFMMNGKYQVKENVWRTTQRICT